MSNQDQNNPGEESNVLREDRKDKLAALREKGLDPYPHTYERSHELAEIKTRYEDEVDTGEETDDLVKVAGRIVGFRDMGKACFLDLKDGTGELQGYTNVDLLGEDGYETLTELDIGDFVGLEGIVFATNRGELSVKVNSFQLLSKSLRPLPEKWHGLQDVEKRYRQRYLDLIANEESKNTFVARSKLISSFRRQLDDMDFLEVETPLMQPAAGGATAEPFVTHHNALDQDLYLRIAPELYLKRLIIGGMEKVYELGKNFRNEGVSTKHNPEFTTIEIYQAYADYEDAMELTEQLIVNSARESIGTVQPELEEGQLDLTPPWNRVSMVSAVENRTDISDLRNKSVQELTEFAESRNLELPESEDEPVWGDFVELLFEKYIEEELFQPTFITDFPTDISPLAKTKRNGEGDLTERFEVFVAGIEVGNAFTELNDPLEQRERFRKQVEKEEKKKDEEFLKALEYGMPPTAGIGIGLDRLLMALTGADSIRDVILFPAMRRKE
ncbi:lysine--tRNA ligase [Candidatus Bipolaricaulota bacterium]|nr:lysine--tRNA ligase [Candidatus Bipolaricaulota bacterium]